MPMCWSHGLDLDLAGQISLGELTEVRAFSRSGGIFVSNDSGMAHLQACWALHGDVFSGSIPCLAPEGAEPGL